MPVTLELQKRSEGTKPRALRREGLIPAVLYGHNGTESINLTLPAKTAENLLKQVNVSKTPIDVTIPDLAWQGKVVLQEVQSHPWRNYIYHLSFWAVSK